LTALEVLRMLPVLQRLGDAYGFQFTKIYNYWYIAKANAHY